MQAILEYWPALVKGLLVTVWMSLATIAGSALGGLMLGTLRLARSRAMRVGTLVFIEVTRGVSALVLLFWVFYALPLLPGMPQLSPAVASVLVLSLIGACYAAEIVRGAIEAVQRGQLDACHALGLTRLQALVRVTLPQAMSQIVPGFGSLAADMIKWTSIVSFVGVQDLLYAANAARSATYQTVTIFGLLAVTYWLLCVASGMSFRALESWLPMNRALRATATTASSGVAG